MKMNGTEQQAVDEAADKFLRSGIIEISPTQRTEHLSNFFTVQEPTKRRPILDCTQLNQYLQYQHFKMEGNNRERRLYLQNRPQRRLCSSTYPQKSQKIFDISSQQYSLPVYLSRIRDKSSPTGIFKNNEICDRAIKEAGFENNLLSPRCLFITQEFKPTKTDMQGSGRTFNIIRLHGKLQEEHIYFFKNTGFLGFHLQQRR
jgi:hypothetical protein